MSACTTRSALAPDGPICPVLFSPYADHIPTLSGHVQPLHAEHMALATTVPQSITSRHLPGHFPPNSDQPSN